ncbi:MAG: hypothetical protein EOO04_02235 [Chitinophagaceae bacterium]|nr:MAG: hypothetical protein EOO04_02235 [Chitinophagaceae bacterium]
MLHDTKITFMFLVVIFFSVVPACTPLASVVAVAPFISLRYLAFRMQAQHLRYFKTSLQCQAGFAPMAIGMQITSLLRSLHYLLRLANSIR